MTTHLLGKLDSYKLMIAQYTKRIPVLRDGRDFEMWQYTGKGRLNGINGYVDKSRFMGRHQPQRNQIQTSDRTLNLEHGTLNFMIRFMVKSG